MLFRSNVTPSKNYWKASSLGLAGVQLVIACAKEYSTLQIWLFKSGVPEFNKMAFEILSNHKASIEQELSPQVIDWRNNETTALLEIRIDGIGYRTERSEQDLNDLASLDPTMIGVNNEPQPRDASINREDLGAVLMHQQPKPCKPVDDCPFPVP